RDPVCWFPRPACERADCEDQARRTDCCPTDQGHGTAGTGVHSESPEHEAGTLEPRGSGMLAEGSVRSDQGPRSEHPGADHSG
ncbi:hypothetical protein, partial [Staphylococcus aureus]